MSGFCFTVQGRPVGKGRPRVTTRGTYTPERTREREELIRQYYTLLRGRYFSGQVRVSITARFKPPKSLSRKKQAELIGKGYDRKPDADNIAKLALDALNGVAYKDDNAVVELLVRKVYSELEETEIRITEV